MNKNKRMRMLACIMFPPKCICCGELTDVRRCVESNICICEKCEPKYRRAKAEVCERCNMSADRCTCGIGGRGVRIDEHVKVFYYHADDPLCVQNKIIYALKHKNDIRYHRFAADELSVSLSRYMSENMIDPEECIFTYMPRRRSAVASDGFDQAKRLAECVAEIYGAKKSFKDLFVRHGGGEQKKLSADERRDNIKSSISLKKNACNTVSGRYVVLIDDLLTSGATLAHGKRLLKEVGAKDVLCASVARTK